MYWLDIAILVVLGIGAAFGFWSGLLWQVARVVSLAVSLYLAIAANGILAVWMSQQWDDMSPVAARLLAFVAVFLLVYVILYLITRALHNAIKATRLELADRFLGALLGTAKMAVLASVACAGLVALNLAITRTWLERSTLAPHFAQGTTVIVALIPQEYRDGWNDQVGNARDQLQKKAADAALDVLQEKEAKGQLH